VPRAQYGARNEHVRSRNAASPVVKSPHGSAGLPSISRPKPGIGLSSGIMAPETPERLHNLERIEFELGEQDTLILEQMQRSPASAVSQSHRDLLWRLFREVCDLGLGYALPTVDSDNPDSLRPEIRSARAKVVWERQRIQQCLEATDATPRAEPPKTERHLSPPPATDAPQPVVQNVFHGPVGNVAQNGHGFRQSAEREKDSKNRGWSTEAKIAIATLVIAVLGLIAAWLAVPGFLR